MKQAYQLHNHMPVKASVGLLVQLLDDFRQFLPLNNKKNRLNSEMKSQ